MDRGRVIIQEQSSYRSLLMRKTGSMKWGETIFFAIGVYLLFLLFGWGTPQFKLFTFLYAAVVIGGAPLIYRVLLKPEYTLTPIHLYISIRGQEEKIPLTQVQTAYDLRFIYYINGKKRNLMVSDQFLKYLQDELDKYKQKR